MVEVYPYLVASQFLFSSKLSLPKIIKRIVSEELWISQRGKGDYSPFAVAPIDQYRLKNIDL